MCTFWDTTGLNEKSEETVPAKLAENNLRELVQGLAHSGGIHLIIYCIRGTRLTKALKRNYDLFYVTVCQNNAPVVLVVTGLEHQQGEMERWWIENEAVLRRNGMRFDAHACVTTASSQDPVIQQQRSESRALLRELILKYSGSPSWKADSSFLSRALPVLHTVSGSTAPRSNPGNAATVRKVAVCGSFSASLPGTSAIWDTSTSKIGNTQYQFLRVDKHDLDTAIPRMLGIKGVGLLVFYTSTLVDHRIPLSEVDMMKKFYDAAGVQSCPMIVVLQGCDDDEALRACRADIVSRCNGIQAYSSFVSVSSARNAGAKLDKMIKNLYTEQVEDKAFFKKILG